jgi:hypothetical protein
VRDQGSDGNCWAFASLGSLESYFLPAVPEDFSEDNLAVAAGHDSDYDTFAGKPYSGGNYNMATAELARWNGPVDESSDPYGDYTFVAGLAPLAHVQNVLFLADRSGPTDNDAIKWAVQNEGPVYTAMHAEIGMESSSDSPSFDARAARSATRAARPQTTPSPSSAGTTTTTRRTSTRAGSRPTSSRPTSSPRQGRLHRAQQLGDRLGRRRLLLRLL